MKGFLKVITQNEPYLTTNASPSAGGPGLESTVDPSYAPEPMSVRGVLGGIAAAAIGMVNPHLGSAVGAAISGISTQGLVADMHASNMEAIRLQILVNQETRQFEAASNILKARHDTEMNSIRNLK
jgi:hypothetical protein